MVNSARTGNLGNCGCARAPAFALGHRAPVAETANPGRIRELQEAIPIQVWNHEIETRRDAYPESSTICYRLQVAVGFERIPRAGSPDPVNRW
jgi:hypothetical protein